MRKILLFVSVIFLLPNIYAGVNWMGNHTTSAQPIDSQTIHFYVEMYDPDNNYDDCHAEIGINEGGNWVTYPMVQGANNVNNSTWSVDINVLSNSTKYYFHGWDGGANVYDSNEGANYAITINPTTKSGGDGNWNSVTNWCDGVVPSSSSLHYSIAHNLTLNQDATVGSITINNGVTFTASDGSKANRRLTISNGGTLSNNGTFNAATGVVEFAGTGTISGIINFNDVEINAATNFGSNSTITNNLTVKSTGYADGNAPVYAANSNLIFATGGEYMITTDMILWAAGNTPGKGIPYNVIVSTSTPFHIYAPRNTLGNFSVYSGITVDQGNDIVFQVGGDFINSGVFQIVSDGFNPLIVGGDFINNASASFALSTTNGGDLKVAGDFTDNGTFNHNGRAVFFNGSLPQRISGTSETTLGYVIVENDAHVILDQAKDLTIANNFSIGDGSKAAGSFKIESTASGTGSLITNGEVPANIEVERYINGWSTDVGKDGWHLLSIPFESFTVASSDFAPGATDDLYYYDEPTDMWINWKTGGTPNSDPGFNFVKGKGYLCAYEVNEVKIFNGTLNASNVAVSDLTKEGTGARTEAGWNMVGNPYASAITWNSSWCEHLNSNIAKVYPGTGNYSDVDPEEYIHTAQGFFIQVTQATSITIPTTARIHNSVSWVKSDSSETQTLKFKVTGGTNKYLDETRIRFNEEATEEFDHQFDAFKLFGFSNAPQLYTIVQNEPYSTNTYPEIKTDRVIDMAFKPGTSGEHQIELIENTCNEECFVLLEDKFNHVTIDITTNKTYTFNANTGDNPNRFQLRFSALGVEKIQKESLQAYISGQNLYILGEEGTAQLEVYDIQGRQLFEETVQLTSQFRQALDLPAGVYVVSVQSKESLKTAKVIVK